MSESIQIDEDEDVVDEEAEDDETDDNDDDDFDDGDEGDEDGEDDGEPKAEGASAGGRSRRGRGGPPAPFAPPDDASRKVLEFISDTVKHMGMNCQVHLRRPKDEDGRDIRLEIIGPDAARVIGKRGQVLGALQFLANRVLNRPGEERRYITVDAEGYRSRRDNSLATMAKRLGKQAVTDGKIITFEPMPPRDRRLVHLALAKFEGVVTRSEGEGEDRRVQIIPVRRS